MVASWIGKAYADTFTYEKINYFITGASTCKVMSIYDIYNLTTVNIPPTVVYKNKSYTVTGIGNGAFSNKNSITSLYIPYTVTDIERQTLCSISTLKSITVDSNNPVYDSRNSCNAIIHTATNTLLYACNATTVPATVTAIGQFAFYNFNNSTLTIPSSVKRIGRYAFDNSTINTINLNEGLEIIEYAFSNSNINSIIIPSTVDSIYHDAFSQANLKHVTFKGSPCLGSWCFYDCKNIETMTFEKGIRCKDYAYNGIDGVFSGCSIAKVIIKNLSEWCKSDFKVILPYGAGDNMPPSLSGRYYSDEDTEIIDLVIPEDVTDICGGAFSGWKYIQSVKFHQNVKSIGAFAFSGCSSLHSINLPPSLKKINDGTFDGCTFKTLTIPDSLEYCGSYPPNLEKVIIPNLKGWYKMTFGTVWRDLNATPYNPLMQAKHLYVDENTEITDLVIPGSVTSINANVFRGCEGLKSVTFEEGVASIGRYAFYDCTGLQSVNLPSSITSIDGSAFGNCNGIVDASVNDLEAWCRVKISGLPDSNPFYFTHTFKVKGKEVNNLEIPSTITDISFQAFINCTNIVSLKIPNSVKTIGGLAFSGCSSLETVIVDNTTPPSIKESTFSTYQTTALFVPEGSKKTYQNATYWKNFKSIYDGLPQYDCVADGLYYILDNNKATLIYRDKRYNSYSGNIIIPSQVTRDGKSYEVTKIGDEAFLNCTELTSVSIPESVTTIGARAFSGCKSLSYIDLPDHLKQISVNAFENCPATLYASVPSTTLLCLWNGGYEPMRKESDDKLAAPTCQTIGTTQTTATLAINPYYEGFVYTYDNASIERDTIRLDNLYPNKETAGRLLDVSLNDTHYQAAVSFRTKSTSPTISKVASTASSITVEGTCQPGDAIVLHQEFFAGSTKADTTYMKITGLDPSASQEFRYYVYGGEWMGGTSYRWSENVQRSFSTSALTLTTLEPKVVAKGNVVVSATTNLDEMEGNVGFEWRKIDAPDVIPSKQGPSVIYNGTLEGIVKNLDATSYYKVRPYYKAASGNLYYGEWIGFDPADFSYFEPTVYTNEIALVADGTVTLTGYALQGSDDIIEQGFQYWVQESYANTHAHRAPANGITTVKATGQRMTVEIKGLTGGITYGYRSYVKTATGMTYGEEYEFTTPVSSAIEEVSLGSSAKRQGLQGVYTLSGIKVADSLTEAPHLPKGIYVVNGRKVVVK